MVRDGSFVGHLTELLVLKPEIEHVPLTESVSRVGFSLPELPPRHRRCLLPSVIGFLSFLIEVRIFIYAAVGIPNGWAGRGLVVAFLN